MSAAWLHSDRNRGYLHGPPGQWTEELLPSVLEDGVGTFLFATDNRPTLQRFDAEVVPALRAAVSAGRGQPSHSAAGSDRPAAVFSPT